MCHIPSTLEPFGLDCEDGRRPDVITIMPWKNGKLLVWDATCPDTFVPSYINISSTAVGLVAGLTEERKIQKNPYLDSSHSFIQWLVKHLVS